VLLLARVNLLPRLGNVALVVEQAEQLQFNLQGKKAKINLLLLLLQRFYFSLQYGTGFLYITTVVLTYC
jgi:hypothetical protein